MRDTVKMRASNLSILIISFNCWHYLDICIQSILASDYPILEVVTVDNASMDGTPEKMRTKYPQVYLVQNDENVGHVRAVNQGFKLLTSDRILLLDADTELRPNAIRRMAEFLDDHREVCMVAPRTINSDGTMQETARNFPSPMNGLFGRQSVLTKLFPSNPFSRHYLARDHFDHQDPFQVEFISAACMMFRKTILERVGVWDEGFCGYWVDADWCKRIQKAGGIVYCVPQAVITHDEQNKGFRKKNPKRIIDFHVGAYKFYRRHYTLGMWDPRSVMAVFLLGLRTLLLLLTNILKKAPESYKDPLSLQR